MRLSRLQDKTSLDSLTPLPLCACLYRSLGLCCWNLYLGSLHHTLPRPLDPSEDMGNSNSSQAYLVERRRLHCNSNGVAEFKTCTTTGQPARPGYYKIICNVNINQVHVKGVMCNGETTRSEFYGKMYVFFCVLLQIVKRHSLLGWLESVMLILCSCTGYRPYGNSRIFRYIPMTANTPYLKGFQGQFTAIPNRDVGFELWWMPLD